MCYVDKSVKSNKISDSRYSNEFFNDNNEYIDELLNNINQTNEIKHTLKVIFGLTIYGIIMFKIISYF